MATLDLLKCHSIYSGEKMANVLRLNELHFPVYFYTRLQIFL